MRLLKCFLGLCAYVRPAPCERVCRHCGRRWAFCEIEHPRIRTGRWFYMGRVSDAERAALARFEVQP